MDSDPLQVLDPIHAKCWIRVCTKCWIQIHIKLKIFESCCVYQLVAYCMYSVVEISSKGILLVYLPPKAPLTVHLLYTVHDSTIHKFSTSVDTV